MKHFLIACGGTGGHLAPGIALAEGLALRGHRATLLVSRKRIDARLLEKYPRLETVAVPGAPFTLRPPGCLRFLWEQSRGFFRCRRLVRAVRPEAIVGFGGWTTAAVVLAGALYGVPIALHEANRVPGRAIRMLGRLAWRVYLPPGVSLPGVRAEALRFAGLPVRAEIVRGPRAAACAALGLDPACRILVVLGGSRGRRPAQRLGAPGCWRRSRRPGFKSAASPARAGRPPRRCPPPSRPPRFSSRSATISRGSSPPPTSWCPAPAPAPSPS